MTKRFGYMTLTFCALALVLHGCGKSGSDPVQYPEVLITVTPSGPTTFNVVSLLAGGVAHASIAGQEFTATGPFNIFLENAAPPYQGIFKRTGSAEIQVKLTFMSATTTVEVNDSTLAGKETATVVAGGTINPSATPGVPIHEVRFDVCAPSPGTSTCFLPGTSGIFAIGFNGTIGDEFESHVALGVTPSIYFLEAARQNVNAAVSRTLVTGDPLVMQLILNGTLRQTVSSPQNVVIREDL